MSDPNPRSLAGELVEADFTHQEDAAEEYAALTPLYEAVTAPGWGAIRAYLEGGLQGAMEALVTCGPDDVVRHQQRIQIHAELIELPATTARRLAALQEGMSTDE